MKRCSMHSVTSRDLCRRSAPASILTLGTAFQVSNEGAYSYTKPLTARPSAGAMIIQSVLVALLLRVLTEALGVKTG